MVFNITSLIAIPLPSSPYPFPPLPVELVRSIFEIAASEDQRTSLSFLLVSKPVRRWIHPVTYGTIEIFSLRRMIDFAAIFSDDTLLATSVRNLTLYDDTPGDFVSPALALDTVTFLPRILVLCKGVRRLAVNYIRGIPTVDGPRPYELTVRRGLRNIRLDNTPLDGVTHLHCRFEQLMQGFTKRFHTTRVTHLCFTHHLDFPDVSCQETVARLLEAPQIQVLIVEVAFQKWHNFEDPSVRRALADNPDGRLFVRMSKYDTVRPYDSQPVFPRDSREAYEDVWDVSAVRDWRTRPWEEEAISRVYNLVQDRTLPDVFS